MVKNSIRMMKIVKMAEFCFLLSTLLLMSGCNRYVQSGLYSSPDFDYWIALNNDSTFLYHYRFQFFEDVSSGTWTQKGNRVYLRSNVPDVMCFPVALTPLVCEDSNSSFIVFKGLNLKFYEWFCLVGNDTIHLEKDTLYTDFSYPAQIMLYAESMDGPKLRKRCWPKGEKHRACYAGPQTLSVNSEPIQLKQKGNYEVAIDSVFGDSPLQYISLHERVYKINKNRIRHVRTNWTLYLSIEESQGK
jgi:hypothetical protein